MLLNILTVTALNPSLEASGAQATVSNLETCEANAANFFRTANIAVRIITFKLACVIHKFVSLIANKAGV